MCLAFAHIRSGSKISHCNVAKVHLFWLTSNFHTSVHPSIHPDSVTTRSKWSFQHSWRPTIRAQETQSYSSVLIGPTLKSFWARKNFEESFWITSTNGNPLSFIKWISNDLPLSFKCDFSNFSSCRIRYWNSGPFRYIPNTQVKQWCFQTFAKRSWESSNFHHQNVRMYLNIA